MKNFGDTLRDLLVEVGSSQSDLVDLFAEHGAPLTSSAISQWATGRTVPGSGYLAIILREVCQTEEQRARLIEAACPPRPTVLTDAQVAEGVA